MKLNGLAALHASMREAGMLRARFKVQHNHLTFACLFLADITPYELALGCVGRNLLLLYKVDAHFETSPYLGDQFGALKEALRNGAHTGNALQPSVFLAEIDGKLPRTANAVAAPTGSDIARVYRHVEDADKIYFCGLQDNSSRGRRVTPSNLEKTRLFLGESAYDFCRSKNISSCWTDDARRERAFG
ncbi:DUF6037 family protein [Lysobacter arvi]|uniref:DUF6037 family protein n=1 Tax=Lysobacter arvi TaxID=3038776 RepID=A0ABU1CEA2_9GAMM|nr:DUF6037 family protein [Lysobacter arvi]MDR0182392.1 DUF6037 family protein [Lysobacter arvi]